MLKPRRCIVQLNGKYAPGGFDWDDCYIQGRIANGDTTVSDDYDGRRNVRIYPAHAITRIDFKD